MFFTKEKEAIENLFNDCPNEHVFFFTQSIALTPLLDSDWLKIACNTENCSDTLHEYVRYMCSKILGYQTYVKYVNTKKINSLSSKKNKYENIGKEAIKYLLEADKILGIQGGCSVLALKIDYEINSLNIVERRRIEKAIFPGVESELVLKKIADIVSLITKQNSIFQNTDGAIDSRRRIDDR